MTPERYDGKHARRPPNDSTEGTRLRLQETAEREPDTVPDEYLSQPIELWTPHEASRLLLARSVMAGLISGVGALATGAASGDITLAVALMSLAAALAAAGSVYGITGDREPLRSDMEVADLDTLRATQRNRQ